MKRDREKVENEVARNANTYLEHVLKGIRRFLPTTHEMFVPLSHEEVEILILFPGYDAVVINAFLVIGHRPPSVSVDGF